MRLPHVTSFHTKFKEDINRSIRIKTDLHGEFVARQIASIYGYCDHVWAVNAGTARTLEEYGYRGM